MIFLNKFLEFVVHFSTVSTSTLSLVNLGDYRIKNELKLLEFAFKILLFGMRIGVEPEKSIGDGILDGAFIVLFHIFDTVLHSVHVVIKGFLCIDFLLL